MIEFRRAPRAAPLTFALGLALIAGLVATAPSMAATSTDSWTQQSPATSPSVRENPAMAYDPATGHVVLFGGRGHGLLDDTWTWDGSDWTERSAASSPPAREDASMAYDAATGQMVLFGGTIGEEEGDFLNDTWTYGPSALPPAPPVTPLSTPIGPVANGPAASTNPPASSPPPKAPPPSPRVTLSRGPRHPGKSGAVHYTFRFMDQDRGATFECRLDRAPFEPCHLPKVYRQPTRGRHVFKVEAIAGGVASVVRKAQFLVPSLSSPTK